MADERNEDRVVEANKQMEKLIKRYIDSSMNNNDLYGKAFECLLAMREVCLRDDEVFAFNRLAMELKKNSEFFALMQAAKCTLITKEESALGNGAVDQKEANDFLTQKAPSMLPTSRKPNEKMDDID